MPKRSRWVTTCPICDEELSGPDQITLEARVGTHIRKEHYYVYRLTRPLILKRQEADA